MYSDVKINFIIFSFNRLLSVYLKILISLYVPLLVCIYKKLIINYIYYRY